MWDALSNERMRLSFTTDAGPHQRILRSESHGTHNHILLPVWDSSNLEGQVPIFISPQKQDTQLYP
jgi:hypothetical protein